MLLQGLLKDSEVASPPGQVPAGHLGQDSVRKAKGRAGHICVARQHPAVSAEIPTVCVHRVQKPHYALLCRLRQCSCNLCSQLW